MIKLTQDDTNRIELTQDTTTSSELNIKFENDGNNLTFKAPGKETLDGFLSKELSKGFLIENNEILVSVLKAFDKWLNDNGNAVTNFAAFVRLHDPNLIPGEQGKETDIFRTKCLVALARLADKLKLKNLLMAILIKYA